MNVDAVYEKLKSKISEIQSTFDEVECISKSFERRNKGYQHSDYLCFVAAKNLLCKHGAQRVAFTLGPGQGKSWGALLIAEKHAKDG